MDLTTGHLGVLREIRRASNPARIRQRRSTVASPRPLPVDENAGLVAEYPGPMPWWDEEGIARSCFHFGSVGH